MKRNHFPKWSICMLGWVGVFWVMEGCAPRPLRPTLRSTLPPASPARVSPTPSSSPVEEPPRTPLPQEAKIREQDLKTRNLILPPGAEETMESPSVTPEAPTGPLPDDSSLLAKITPGTSPRRAASLRLTEEGRKLLEAGDAPRALSRLEKTIVIDSTNPYGYFYLAKAHYQFGRYKESLSFLDVTESRLREEPFWLAEVHALRGENYRALGMVDKAEASYAEALRLNSGNRTASDALARLQGPSQATSR
ncbi:MAG TPA: tetratricopeptide repeat protein [Candidatus Binatia bacterium]|nr:tetratricopeptide repeat protein [Candidatus Binatia bacterium]